MDVDAADVFALEIGFVGDRADDVAGFHAMHVSDFDAVSLHAGIRRAARADVLAWSPFRTYSLHRARRMLSAYMLAAYRARGVFGARRALERFARLRLAVRSQQQRGLALQHLLQRRCDVGRRYVMLLLVALDQVAVQAEIARFSIVCRQRRADA